jgi:amino acid transporter
MILILRLNFVYVSSDKILIAVGLVFLTKDVMPCGNIILWLMLSTGFGVLLCLYGLEWYARVNCPQVLVNITCPLLSCILCFFSLSRIIHFLFNFISSDIGESP